LQPGMFSELRCRARVLAPAFRLASGLRCPNLLRMNRPDQLCELFRVRPAEVVDEHDSKHI
jgi:hypothetical protein